MMKSIIQLGLILGGFAVVPSALAADISGGGNFFLDATYGKMFGKQASTGDTGYTHSSQSAWRADGGYRWKLDDARSLGLEVGYMHLGIVADNSDANGFLNADTTASAMTAGVNFHYVFGADEAWLFQLRAGVMTVKFAEDYSSFIPGQPTTAGSSSSRQGGAYFGFGIGRDLTRNLSLVLALEYYHSGDTGNYYSQNSLGEGLIGLGAEYRF